MDDKLMLFNNKMQEELKTEGSDIMEQKQNRTMVDIIKERATKYIGLALTLDNKIVGAKDGHTFMIEAEYVKRSKNKEWYYFEVPSKNSKENKVFVRSYLAIYAFDKNNKMYLIFRSRDAKLSLATPLNIQIKSGAELELRFK